MSPSSDAVFSAMRLQTGKFSGEVFCVSILAGCRCDEHSGIAINPLIGAHQCVNVHY